MAARPEFEAAPTRNRLRPWIWGGAALLLLLPLVAMQFTPEVRWDGADFVAMGLLLAAACGAYEVGARMSGDIVYRAAFAIAVLAGFLLVWVNLAVGVIGGEGNPANLMYLGVLAVAGIGSLAARFRADDMVRVLLATAMTQAAVALIAFLAGLHDGRTLQLVGVTAFFLGPWLLSAALFAIAARRHATAIQRGSSGPSGSAAGAGSEP